MFYHSTRSCGNPVDSAFAVIQGLAPDGGLYMPQNLPAFDAAACLQGDFYAMARQLLGAFLPDIPNMDDQIGRAHV